VLTWSEVATRLAPERSYWLGTTNGDGSPHAAPVWGVVVDDCLYLYTERRSVKARNLARDPRAIVHLPDGEEVVIVHGRLEDLGRPVGAGPVVEALAAKYDRPEDRQYLPASDEDFDVLYALRPERALLWRLSDYEGSQERWSTEP
jgi:PPOX class probable F420-dependent enzyme